MFEDGGIVVFGGTGFIGKALVRQLLEGGGHVRVVSRRPAPFDSMDSRVSYRTGDVADEASVSNAVRGASVVFHLATGGGPAWADFERDMIEGSRNVANACLKHRVRRLVYTSSIAALYLGESRHVDESCGTDPKPAGRSLYSRGKIAAERVLRELHEAAGLPVVIVRPGVVVGRNGLLNHSGIGLWAADTCCLGWGRGKTPLPMVLVDDVARGLIGAMETEGIEGRCFNLVGDARPPAGEWVRTIADRSARNFRFYPQSLIKMQTVEILKWAIKCAARKPENPFPSYHDLKSRSLCSQFDCTAAKRILGWQPNASLETLFAEAIDAHVKPVLDGDLRRSPAPSS